MQVATKEKSRNNNPISKQHFEQVIKRPHRLKDAMIQVWGLTWELNGRRFFPLGQVSALAQYSDEYGPQQACVTAAGHNSPIIYGRVRMLHDWGRNPYVGATSRILDPREKTDPSVQPGDRPNASWVRAGLLVDGAREEATRVGYDLPAVPALPGFCYAYAQKPEYSGVTPYLTACAALNGEPVTTEVAMSTAFDMTVIHPEDNGLGLYLVPFEAIAEPGRHLGIYEDFGYLLGRRVPNPVLELTGIKTENPVWRAAKTRRVHLRTLLADLDRPTADGADEDDTIAERCGILRSGMREVLGVTADTFLDADLTEAMINPEQSLVSTKGIADMSIDERMTRVHALLEARNPYILADAAEDDLNKAVRGFYSPLTLSKACSIQTLYRDPRRSPMDTLDFPSTALNRPNVTACFAAPDDWKPVKRA